MYENMNSTKFDFERHRDRWDQRPVMMTGRKDSDALCIVSLWVVSLDYCLRLYITTAKSMRACCGRLRAVA